MPDAEGNFTADSGTDTPLHAGKEESGFGSSDPHQEDVKGDPTAQDIVDTPMEERNDPQKNFNP
ncbi:MAG TPA: hypothetical protein VHJ78_04765 [Actinomycetota bacterium]|nr:hypothetical protein [Actinomycetota bacterium]